LNPDSTSDHRSRDLDLVRRARDGDDSAFREIVETYEGAVAATVIGMRAALEAMVGELEPLLDEDQLERLRRFAERPPPAAGGPGRRGRPPKR
jgi:hypothetical protein